MSVTESISWPKDFQELKVIDGLLRCGICYDYLRTCLVTPCSHNYCSFCIRKSMQYKTQCPICFKETFEVNLQNNRVLDELVDNFRGMRDRLIRHLRVAEVHLSIQQTKHMIVPDMNATPLKMKTEVGKTSTSKNNPLKLKTPETKKKKSSNKKLKTSTLKKTDTKEKNVSLQLDSLVITTDEEDEGGNDIHHNDNSGCEAGDSLIADKENNLSSPQESFVKGKAIGIVIPEIFLQPISPKKKVVTKNKEPEDIEIVPCPVCSVQIPQGNINIHLDRCLYRPERPCKKQTKPDRKRTPLPKLVYSMMSEKDLRKKLKDHSLDQKGDKKTLISRLQRFTVLYNSECDAIEPRPVSAIIQQIETEEKDEKRLQQTHRPVINRNTDPKIIEEENNKYIQENKDSFATLIKSLREREVRKSKAVTIIDDDDDDDDDKEGSDNNDVCDDRKGNMNLIKENVKHKEEDTKNNMFSSNPSTSTGCTMHAEKEDEELVEIVDNSSDDELCFASIMPSFTAPKSINMMSKSCIDNSNKESDSQNEYIVEVTKTPTKRDKIIVNTQKLSDEELGIQNEISSDVNSVYQASDNEEDRADNSDNESVSLLAPINEESLNNELIMGNLADADDGSNDFHKYNNTNSQIKDPDFVVNTQDLEDAENTEEFFEPSRKPKVTPMRNLKRKVIRPIFTDSDDSNDGNCDSDDNNDGNCANRDHDEDDDIKDTPRRLLRKRIKH